MVDVDGGNHSLYFQKSGVNLGGARLPIRDYLANVVEASGVEAKLRGQLALPNGIRLNAEGAEEDIAALRGAIEYL